MQWCTRNRLAAASAALILVAAACGSGAWSQTSRTIRMILPFPPGGPADAMARLMAEQVGAAGGPTMVIESHPGAGTEIGTEYVSRAVPDGDTLAIISNSFVLLPHLRKLNYEPLTDFVPICELASFPPLIVVNSESSYRKLVDLIDAAHARPEALTLATLGPATASQMAFEMLKHEAKADIVFVPFPGYTPAIQALLGKQVTSALADYTSLQGQLQTGKLRAIATTARKRIASLADVPTVEESGYPGFEAEFFGGLVAPAKTPKETVAQLVGWVSAALQSPEINAKFAKLGFFPAGACGSDFGAILRSNYDKYGRIVRESNIKQQ